MVNSWRFCEPHHITRSSFTGSTAASCVPAAKRTGAMSVTIRTANTTGFMSTSCNGRIVIDYPGRSSEL